MILSIIIPVFNEESTILKVIEKINAVQLNGNIQKEIVIVDDGSFDGTAEKLRTLMNKPGYKIVFQNKNQGKTAAVKKGFTAAQGDILLIQDADLEYDPAFYPALLEPILKDGISVVYGSRFLGEIKNIKLAGNQLDEL